MVTAASGAKVYPINQSEPRRVSILGATGSVGCSTIDLIKRHPDAFEVVAVTANRSVDRLAEQAKALNADFAVVSDERCYQALKDALSGSDVEAAAGKAAVDEAAQRSADWVMAGIVGAAGLSPTLEAIKRGAIVALANKEALVCGGCLVTDAVARHGARLLPVDSEHNAIYQVLETKRPEAIDRIILTASGGPFRRWSLAEMKGATREQALAHPNWDMGAKISIDSATMMNKGLEVIEAHHLFGLPSEQLEVVVHPQSVIHSMVAYVDGSVLAQLGQPDMRTPIAYTLAWPERMPTPVEKLTFAEMGDLSFEAPDSARFPALRLSREALISGGSVPVTLNAANEVAVDAFLNRQIGFMDITGVVEATMEKLSPTAIGSLDDLYACDNQSRQAAQALLPSFTQKR
ncbi:MAG: 1-deoxy-D-xylulose-5-phosphate reductoisomerase [Pseudomonadota bacterium]